MCPGCRITFIKRIPLKMTENIIDSDKSVYNAGYLDVNGVALGRDGGQNGPGRYRDTADFNFNLDLRIVLNDCMSNRDELDLLLKKCGDGSRSKISKCESIRCLFKSKFSPCDKIVSSSTFRTYDCVIPDDEIDIDCHSSNVVYLITCNNCKLQYVGETCQKLNKRFNWHNSGFKYPNKYGFCKILNNHFNNGLCKDSQYSVKILEKLSGSGRTENDSMDISSNPIRKQRELHWMLKLRTIYPYGLNDRIGDEYKDNNIHVPIGNRFPSLKRSFERTGRGMSRKGIPSTTPVEFVDNLKNILRTKIAHTSNFIRTSLSSMKKSFLKIVYDKLDTELNETNSEFLYTQWYLLALDFIESKIFKLPIASR